ncbi:MAG: DUF4303 domain-containing protein [Planctomycetaceae bacterium]|nr:DUF4303 domain-containing protein [Planctomycetaceae bacterium]
MNSDRTLTELIIKASTQAFADWRAAFPDERVFAFALSTLDDAIYVNASLNSEESHARTIAKRELEPSSAHALDAKWGPWEWENEFTGQSHFNSVDDRLKQMYDEMHEDSFAEFRTTVLDSMLQALVQLKDEGIITNNGNPTGIALFATIYDSFQAEEMHRRSAEMLNSQEAAAELLSVIGG